MKNNLFSIWPSSITKLELKAEQLLKTNHLLDEIE